MPTKPEPIPEYRVGPRCRRELCFHEARVHVDGGECWIIGCPCRAFLSAAEAGRLRRNARRREAGYGGGV